MVYNPHLLDISHMIGNYGEGGVDLIKSFSEENISITNTQSFVTHLCILHDLANVRYTHSPIIHDIYDSYLLILDIYYSMYKLRF